MGLVCRRDHEVFGAVARRLEAAGLTVTFFDPGTPIATESLADLSLLVNKAAHPESFRALAWAERHGLPTWNGYETALLAFRLVGYRALEWVGFEVPPVSTTPPAGPHLTKRIVDWNPAVDTPVPVFHQELVDARPVDYKYYAVDDGTTCRTVVLRATSKLWGEKRILGEAEPLSEHARRIETLMDRLGMRALGVDLVRADGTWYAVDLNPCPSFRGTGLTDALVASIESCLE